MKFYITKYALTQGVFEVNSEDMREVKAEDGRLILYEKTGNMLFFHAGEWFTEKAFAIKDAELRRNKKIASLQKQIAKLENMKFE